MPSAQTFHGWRARAARAPGTTIHRGRPMHAATAKHIALSWNGGTASLAAVNSASSDHISTAVKPMPVASLRLLA